MSDVDLSQETQQVALLSGEQGVTECPICGPTQEASGDFRTLSLSFFYALEESSDKLVYDEQTKRYSVRVCKDCRSEFIALLGAWLEGNFIDRKYRTFVPGERDIPVRQAGAVVWLSEDEWREEFPDREPIRMTEDMLEEVPDGNR